MLITTGALHCEARPRRLIVFLDQTRYAVFVIAGDLPRNRKMTPIAHDTALTFLFGVRAVVIDASAPSSARTPPVFPAFKRRCAPSV